MNSPGPGFHPWQRLSHRLRVISPHRQVQLLCAISVVTEAVMVVAVLGSLNPTQAELRVANDHLVPAIEQLDRAHERYSTAAAVLPQTISADPDVRAVGVTELTSANTGGESAYKRYLRLSSRLPRERGLQESFAANRGRALDAGVELLSQPQPTAAQLAAVTQISNAMRLDLNRLKELYETKVQEVLHQAAEEVNSTQRQIVIISSSALLLLLVAFGIAARSARAREEHVAVLDRALHQDAERNELEARLQRSFEMAHNESAAFELVRRALSMTVADTPAELLVADSSRAHFRQATTTDDHGGSGCAVMTPNDCPAATWGQTQVWPSSTALDACPHLQGRPAGECAALCVPVSIGGNTVGVVHVITPDGQPSEGESVVRVELIARKVGERVGMLRAFARSETQAHTDPLTGLMNRRSVETQVRELTEQGRTYVAAYGDLDHFKQLNDVHGHDAGDQALRLFARVLRETVRPGDFTARYGGEEFVVVLPDCTTADAYLVVDRIRERLALAQVDSSGPRFTVSFGITRSRPEQTFSETLEVADAALLEAKAKGRDRVIVSGPEGQNAGISSEPVSSDAPTISSTRS